MSSMWLVVLFLGLGGVLLAVFAWYMRSRRQRRVERARPWREHQDWVERSSRHDPP